MAIDNDTSYELTGAQIKDLAQKIRNKADDNTFVGSSSGTAGSKGLVPAPAAGSQNKVLKGDGSWASVTSNDIDWSTTPQSYSTSEVDTGATWVDGKTIYKKTIYKASIASGDTSTQHGISNIDLVVKHEAFMVSSGQYVPLTAFVNTSGGNYFAVWKISSSIIQTFSSLTITDAYFTIYYTKTSS